jgi:ankyrin repeat protein
MEAESRRLGGPCSSTFHDTLRVLLRPPEVDINVPAVYHQPLLYTAIESGQIPTVRLLLERPDLDINALNEPGESAIFLAIARKEPDVAILILESRSDLDPNLGYSIISLACGEVITFF